MYVWNASMLGARPVKFCPEIVQICTNPTLQRQQNFNYK